MSPTMAIRIINQFLVVEHQPILSIRESLKAAIAALEKQTAKEPTEKIDKDLGYAWFCPSCHYIVFPHEKHCADCGQKIDWSGEK